METKSRVREILSWYPSDNPGTLANLYRLLTHGRLAGTGKLVILPVDQGFEHGPARSFAPNPPGYDPEYHVQLLSKGHPPESAVTGSVRDAVRLGCAAIGYTIYPGSSARNHQYENLRALIEEAKASGLAAVTWSYPRGEGITDKKGETAVDVAAYAAQIACQLGSHVVKVKPPAEFVYQPEAQKVFEKYNIPWKTLADRTRHVVQSCFNGKRIVIFSGGEAKSTDEILTEIRGLRDGGSFGSIMGRNAFQRPRAEAIQLLRDVMDIYTK